MRALEGDGTTAPSRESELVMTRGEPEGYGPSTSLGAGEVAERHVPDSGDIDPASHGTAEDNRAPNRAVPG